MGATRPTHAERSRTLVAQQKEGALSTSASDPAGHPYGSFVTYAALGESVVLLLSGLAEHTKNLEADPRASLLVVEPRREQETLARDRVTLLGTCRRVRRSEVEPTFLARHPSAERYASFADFGCWRLEVESARFVGGFGRMSWIAGQAWREAEVDPLCDAEGSILAHMNEDHADACLAYARAFAGVAGASRARMTAVDRYGFELAIDDGASARIAFPSPVASAQDIRKVLVAMVRDARARLGE